MDINPLKCAQYIQETAPLFAQAKANRVYIENYLKTVKAVQMNASDSTSLGQKEADAYASADYKLQLEALKEAVEQEERYRWMLTAAQAKLEIWKTTQYVRRAEMKNLQ